MTRRAIPIAALLLAGTGVWSGLIVTEAGPWRDTAALLLAGDLLILTAASVVGVLVAASRWARRLGIGVAAAGLGLAVVMPIDGWWWVGVVASGAALGGLVGTAFKGLVRERPAASGPPAEAVLLALALTAAPGLVGLVSPGGLSPLATAGALVSAGIGVWYLKAAPGALWVVRLGAPLALVVTAAALWVPAGLAVLGAAALVGWLAWTSGARVAVVPLVEQGTRVRIPPELAPREVLDAAGLDDRGRRREDG